MLSYGKQSINQNDIDSVIEVLKSDFLTQGPQVPIFEKTVSKYCNTKFAVAVNSATSALHLACIALGLKKNDILWTSTNSFVASANCGLYCGALVDFVDIDPLTYNLCCNALETKLKKAKQENKLPKILVAVHFAGQSCDMKKIYSLSQEYGFKIIEDASHAIGGRYLNEPVGNCNYSDIAVFSFHPVKIITTGEGGMALTNNKVLYEKMYRLRTHGITNKVEYFESRPDNEIWNYQQIELGFNYRMTDIQAALGISQMKSLDSFVSNRHTLKDRYNKILKELPLILPYQSKSSYSSLHLYPVQIEKNYKKKSHLQIYNELKNRGIGVNIHYIPIHKHPYYQKMGFTNRNFPNAENYYDRTITLPLFSSMSFEQQDTVVEALKEVLI